MKIYLPDFLFPSREVEDIFRKRNVYKKKSRKSTPIELDAYNLVNVTCSARLSYPSEKLKLQQQMVQKRVRSVL
uniref:Uncharacterized protein n=1 Tax=Rhizophagus irregularis (strain DAOM 181602 / DAOM 197198 / MUCL 43194) TaxID=747089 RepID=U9SYU4_RHIID